MRAQGYVFGRGLVYRAMYNRALLRVVFGSEMYFYDLVGCETRSVLEWLCLDFERERLIGKNRALAGTKLGTAGHCSNLVFIDSSQNQPSILRHAGCTVDAGILHAPCS
jgi:hypothetical protein